MLPMRSKSLLVLFAAVAVVACAFASVRAAAAPTNPRDEWIVQTRAADAIGEVLMGAMDRAESQVDLLRRQLQGADQNPAPAPVPAAAATTSATRESRTAYRALVDQVVAEVRRIGGGGPAAAGQADQSLEDLPDSQLFSEMAALQTYNLRTFRRLTELRAQAAELRKQLKSSGREKAGTTTAPSIATPANLARDAIAALSRDPGPRWASARQRMRNAIATAHAQQQRYATAGSNGVSATPGVPPPPNHGLADDPRWQPYFYGPGDTFIGWGDALSHDPFNFHGGGGRYERADTRVNTDYDTRTQGQSDRRVNVNADRRVNIHVDPRQNF